MKKDLTGKTFNRLKAISVHHKGRHGLTFYKFSCKCGSFKVLCGTDVSAGKTKSCGCIRKGRPCLPIGEAAFNSLYLAYMNCAKNRGLEFKLTPQEFRFITKLSCVYCGIAPEQEWKGSNRVSSPYIYNGVDRIDNLNGYTTDNVSPCCVTCNMAKRSLSLKQFTAWVKRLVDFQNLKVRVCTPLGVK